MPVSDGCSTVYICGSFAHARDRDASDLGLSAFDGVNIATAILCER